MRRMVVAGIALVCAAFIAGGAVEGQPIAPVPEAPVRTPTQVEVTNFPAVQPVSGAVNVANLPAVQSVAGDVQVTNLPLDAAGNLRVSTLGQPAVARTLEVRFTEADRNSIGRFPLIPLPPGYGTATIHAQTLDATRASVVRWAAGFGTDTVPFAHYTIGDFQVFGFSSPLNFVAGILYVTGDFAGTYRVSGTHLQLLVEASAPVPPETEYYVYLHLSN